jgi:hypothetical protein
MIDNLEINQKESKCPQSKQHNEKHNSQDKM